MAARKKKAAQSLIRDERAARCVSLRRQGLTIAAIAGHVGLSPARVCELIGEVREEWSRERVADVAALTEAELSRLETLEGEIEAQMDVARGRADLAAFSALAGRKLSLSERRAKLLGLDKPTKVAPTSPDGASAYTGLVIEETLGDVG